MDLQNINIQDLFGRRIIDLTGAELSLLIYDATVRAYNNVMHESGVNKQAQPNLIRGVRSLAQRLNVSESKVKSMIRSGELHEPALIRSGRVIWFNWDEVTKQVGEDVVNKWQTKIRLRAANSA